MKKLIAGAALVSTILGSGAAALADTSAATTTATTNATTTTTQADATVQADSNLPQVTLTPDKMLYVLKMWAEKIRLVVTTDAADKAAVLEAQAQTRLAEARAMAQAGKQDLAQAALQDAKAKLEAAQKAIEAAAKADKDMSKLTAKLEADQTSFAGAITAMLDKAPESVRTEFQPVAAELMVQLAANQDAAKKDDAAAREAAKVAEEAKLETAGLQPRMVLVLNSMAQASGKDLSEVYAMYKQNPGLGHIAKELGLSMGAVQHTAQIEWKVSKGAVTTAPEAPATPAPTAATPAPTSATQASLETAAQAQVNTAAQAVPAPAPAAPAPVTKESVKAAVKEQAEAAKAAEKAAKAAAKSQAKGDDDEEKDDDEVEIHAESSHRIAIPLVNLKAKGEHDDRGHKGDH